MKWKQTLFVLLLPICIYLSGCFIIDSFAPYSIIKPYRCTEEDLKEHLPEGITPSSYGLKGNDAIFTVRDSMKIVGWFIRANDSFRKGTVLMIHGISSCKEPYLAAARFWSSNGYNALIFDLPAHGQSGGEYTTFGYYESEDISQYLDSVVTNFEAVEPVAVIGNSMGAAVAMQLLADNPRVKCGIIENSFDDFREIVKDYTRAKVKILSGWISGRAIRKAEEIAEFEADSLHISQIAKRIRQPVLMVHGEDDKKISINYGKNVFEALQSNQKEWYPIAKAGHDNLWEIGGEAYQDELLGFLSLRLRN